MMGLVKVLRWPSKRVFLNSTFLERDHSVRTFILQDFKHLEQKLLKTYESM